MADNGLSALKSEILFFMDKMFQVSFAYLGSLFAVIAGAEFDVVRRVADYLRVSPAFIVVNAFLLLNLAYLTFICSCMYAVLKRGHFILSAEAPSDPTLLNWEIHLRHPPAGFNRVIWNIDNYYVIFFFLLIFTGSGGAMFALITHGQESNVLLPAILLSLHIIPLLACCYSWQLSRRIKTLRFEPKPK